MGLTKRMADQAIRLLNRAATSVNMARPIGECIVEFAHNSPPRQRSDTRLISVTNHASRRSTLASERVVVLVTVTAMGFLRATVPGLAIVALIGKCHARVVRVVISLRVADLAI